MAHTKAKISGTYMRLDIKAARHSFPANSVIRGLRFPSQGLSVIYSKPGGPMPAFG